MTDKTEASAPAADATDEAIWNEAPAEAQPAEDTTAAPVAADDAAAPQEDTPPPDAAPQDIWADAPEPLRNEFLDLKERYEKDHRQIAGHRRKEMALIQQLSAPAPDPAARAAEIDTALDGLEDYPEIKAAVQRITAPLYENITNAEAARQAARTDYLVEQANLLEEDIPGFEQFLNDNRPAFKAFVEDEEQPAWVHKAFKANETDVTDAAMAARLISRFKEILGQPPVADPPQRGPSDRRARQMSGLSSPPPRGGAATTTLPASADPEAIWNEAVRKDKQREA